ncbi:MAG TPA: Vms1/Ankzf1 family peptidyl-tRNA hydrolase [Ilumatobacter sp.]
MTTLSDLFRLSGPFASVLVRTPSSASDAVHQLEIRWKNARRDLEAGGASEPLLAEFDSLAAQVEHGHSTGGVAAILSKGADPYIEFLSADPRRNEARLGAVPTVTPIIASRQAALPLVVAFVDRTGADLAAVTAGSIDDYVIVEGERAYIHRGQAGGWSQRRYQQRAENRWESNANESAEALGELAHRVGARLVCVSGDVRAVGFLVDHLATDLKPITKVLQEGDSEAVWAAADREIAELVRRESDALVATLNDRLPHRTATTNQSDVLRAIGEGRAQTLLVHDDGSEQLDAWCGPGVDPICSLHQTREDFVRGRLVDVAVRGAVLTGATVRVIDAAPSGEGPLAALLRW